MMLAYHDQWDKIPVSMTSMAGIREDITVEDVERIKQFLTPSFPDEMDEVIQPLTPQPILPPNDDYVAPATKLILDELLEEFRDEILNVTMVDEEADFNLTRDIEELERLLAKHPYYYRMIQMEGCLVNYWLQERIFKSGLVGYLADDDDDIFVIVEDARRSRLEAWLRACKTQAFGKKHEDWTLNKALELKDDLLRKVPHHGIDLWLQVQIFYDHVNPVTRRTINQSAGGKLRDRNAKESRALLEDLHGNESWNDPRDFAKPVKAIALPQDVPSTSNRRLIELDNQVQRLMEAHLAPTQPTQVDKSLPHVKSAVVPTTLSIAWM
ncbi:hypothetical protein Tco_0110345 [Tanacetum coccineum]